MDATVVWFVIAAVFFGMAALVRLIGDDPRLARIPLVALGLLAMTIGFIAERT